MKKTRKHLFLILTILTAIFLLTACGTLKQDETVAKGTNQSLESVNSPAAKKGVLLMATTTSTADTGLLDYLAPIFLNDTGWELQWSAVGTGEALQMGKNGDVDVVFVHAKASEEEFVADGYGVQRFPVMYNDFVVIGTGQPIIATSDVAAVFKQIVDQNLSFVSRGDDSGTDKAEKKIWKKLELDPTANTNYVESGQGMGATITMASEKNAYCFADRGTWLKMKTDATIPLDLEIVCEGDPSLKNQYGVIAVSTEKYPDVNSEGANAFIAWICSERVQKLIGEFGVDKYGQALFTPNAGTES